MSNIKKRVLAYPIIDELKYTQRIDTKQLNEMMSSIESSILRAIIRSTELSVKVNALNLGIINSYNSLYAHEKSYQKYPSYYNTCFATAFSNSLTGGKQNQNAGVVTLNWDDYNKQSKIPMIDGVLSPNINIYVNGELRDQDDDVYNILDGDPSTFWIEETSNQKHTLEIELPPSLNKRFNYLELVPFPIFGIEITKITYKDLQGANQVIFDTNALSTTFKPYRFYNTSGPMVFHLSPKEYNNNIKIDYKVKDGCSAMGFSTIDVSLVDYYNTATTILIPFENLPNVQSITPTKIDLDFYIDGVVDSNLNKFFSKNGGGIFITNNSNEDLEEITPIQGPQIKTWSSIDIRNGLWLKIVMNEVDMTTSVFRGCKMEFTTA